MPEQRPAAAAAPEEIEAEKNLARERPAEAVRRLLRAERQAVLSTLSAAREGWPFASLAPYALSRAGEPVLLLAGLAQHTRNIALDPRSCLFVQDRAAEADPQAGARATVLGRVRRAERGEVDDARARYLAVHPQAEKYFDQHDFALYLHSVDEVRYIGGFGVIGWVPGHAVLLDAADDAIAAQSEEIARHVNGDHAAALALLCRSRGKPGRSAQLLSVDAHGFDAIDSDAGRLRFDFDAPAHSPEAVRDRFVSMVRAARQRAAR